MRSASQVRTTISAPTYEVNARAQGIAAGALSASWQRKLSAHAELALLLAAIVPLAFWLRSISLGAQSLNEDEIASVIVACMNPHAFWYTLTHTEANMALYYALLRFWVHLGQNEWTVRSLSLIFGVAEVPAIYALGTRMFGRPVGLLASLLVAINGFHIEFSQNVRGYSLLALLVTLSSFFFFKAIRDGSRRDWIWYVVTSALSIYAHVFAVCVFIAQGIAFLMLPRRRAPWGAFLASATAASILMLPMAFLVLSGRSSGYQASFVPRTTLRAVYNLFGCLAGKTHTAFLPRSGNLLLLALFCVPVVLSVWRLAKLVSDRMDLAAAWDLAFLLTWLLVPILLILGISFLKPTFVDRYLITCLPPFVLLAAYGLTQVPKTWFAGALLCGIGGLTAFGLPTYYHSPGQDWRGAAQYVLSGERAGDAAVFFPFHYQSRLEYYLERETAGVSDQSSAPLPLLIPSSQQAFEPLLRTLPAQYGRVWFVTWDQPSTDLDPENRVASTETLLAAEFPGNRLTKVVDGGLKVVLYTK